MKLGQNLDWKGRNYGQRDKLGKRGYYHHLLEMSKCGIMGVHAPSGTPNVPVSALYAENAIMELKLKLNSTPDRGGPVLGIIKPIWTKALESELRITWLKNMLDRDLVLRDILKFGQIVDEKLRTESSKKEELGRQALIEIMRAKFMDEKRYYRECKRIREVIRDFVRQKY